MAALRYLYLGAASLLCCAVCFAQSAPEYAAKAAFIYNIALFTSFPNAGQGMVRLCVMGRDPFEGAFRALEGRAVGAAKLSVAYPDTGSEAMSQCQIVFISASEADNLDRLAELGRRAGVLTIADIKGAARKGVMVELSVEDKKIVFAVNAEAARGANIALSSKVLRLARAVY